jgi:hypothetical protein
MKAVILELLRRSPFSQFVFLMNGGMRYTAIDAELTVVGKDIIWLFHSDSDRCDILRLTEISSVEDPGPAAWR